MWTSRQKRDPSEKTNFAEQHTWTKNLKMVEVCTCVYVHMLKEITALEYLTASCITRKKRCLKHPVARLGIAWKLTHDFTAGFEISL